MSCAIVIEDLPTPPEGKNGWPWTQASLPLPAKMPDGSPWPKISIVTPSFNQAQYLEETIRSVILQGYPNLEYIIIDGGSTDGSVEIIKEYEPWLTYWVSEPDRGQSHAINKGFERSTGDIMTWLNSDDYYLPNVFRLIAETFSQNQTMWVAGACFYLYPDGKLVAKDVKPNVSLENWLTRDLYAQPSVFWKRTLWEKTKKIDEKLHFSFDYDLWLQFVNFQPEAFWINTPLSVFRRHSSSKTSTAIFKFIEEDSIIQLRHLYLIPNFRKKQIIKSKIRERIANFYLSKKKSEKPLLCRILIALWHSPEYVFKRQFYSKLKSLIVDE